MSESAEDIISKQQSILDNFFNLLGNFSFDKAKEFLEKERDVALKNHSVAPFFGSALTAFASLAAAEKNYANFLFLAKSFLRKESSLKSMYEGLATEFQRLNERHSGTPVATPTVSPTASCRTPSPLPSPASSEASSIISFGGISSTRAMSFLGEDVLENLASHLCGQLLDYVHARLKTMDFYDKMYVMSSTRFMKFEQLSSSLLDIVKKNAKLFHHPMLSPLKSSFSCECEILLKLLEAEVQMQSWRFLPSLLCLHDAHSKLASWINAPKEVKKSLASSVYRSPQPPVLYTWLRSLKAALVSKFTLYFHEILSKQAPPAEMKSFCSKSSIDYFSKMLSLVKRYEVSCIALVLDTNGLEDFSGHGYAHPRRQSDAPKGLDSFPPILTYPPNCLSVERRALHWPSVVMIMNNREQDIRSTDSAVSFYDPRMEATYLLSRVESRVMLVAICEGRRADRDAPLHRCVGALCAQLRPNRLFAALKPGSK